MSEVPALIETLIRMEEKTQAQVALESGVARANLCRFLSGGVDMRLSSLTTVLKAVGIDLADLIRQEIHRRQSGEIRAPETLGEALESLIGSADPITAKTLLNSVRVQSRARSLDEGVARALAVIEKFLGTSQKKELA